MPTDKSKTGRDFSGTQALLVFFGLPDLQGLRNERNRAFLGYTIVPALRLVPTNSQLQGNGLCGCERAGNEVPKTRFHRRGVATRVAVQSARTPAGTAAGAARCRSSE